MDGDGSEMKGYPVSGVMVEEKNSCSFCIFEWMATAHIKGMCIHRALC